MRTWIRPRWHPSSWWERLLAMVLGDRLRLPVLPFANGEGLCSTAAVCLLFEMGCACRRQAILAQRSTHCRHLRGGCRGSTRGGVRDKADVGVQILPSIVPAGVSWRAGCWLASWRENSQRELFYSKNNFRKNAKFRGRGGRGGEDNTFPRKGVRVV